MTEYFLLNATEFNVDWNYSVAANGSELSAENQLILEHAPHLSKSAVIRAMVLSAMAIVSLLGNTATMWNIYKTRMMRRVTRHSWSAIYSLIFHLSIADLLVTGFCIIGEAAWSYTVQWLAGEFACKTVKLFQMFSLYLSTYVLVLIGVDRWIAVKYPMKSLNMAKRCYRLLGGAYVLSFMLSLPQVREYLLSCVLAGATSLSYTKHVPTLCSLRSQHDFDDTCNILNVIPPKMTKEKEPKMKGSATLWHVPEEVVKSVEMGRVFARSLSPSITPQYHVPNKTKR